jgi:hypothetical protein
MPFTVKTLEVMKRYKIFVYLRGGGTLVSVLPAKHMPDWLVIVGVMGAHKGHPYEYFLFCWG